MTFPSAGCQTCKIRRIKCDEAQPVCQRCTKSQRICHGRPSGQGWIVHTEDTYASGQKKRPRGPRPVPTVNVTASLGSVPQRPLDDLNTQAVAYYMHYHLQTPNDAPNISKGIYDHVLPIWPSRTECPMLDLAVSSMALAVFSRTQRHPPAALEASVKYQRLLQMMHSRILCLDGASVETYLLAISFMSRYEDVVYSSDYLSPRTPFRTSMGSIPHHDGLLTVLKLWKTGLSNNRPATQVIKHARRGLLRSAMMRNNALPEWMLDGASFGESGLELFYDSIFVRISNVRQRLSMLSKEYSPKHKSQELASAAGRLNEEAQDLDMALQDWTAQFPSTWNYRKHTLSDLHTRPTDDFYSPIVYSYLSPAYAAIWNHAFATRMLINSIRLKILSLCRPVLDDFAEQRLECLSYIERMANDLASSVPFCLQRFNVTDGVDSHPDQTLVTLNTKEDSKPYLASQVVWPLTIASCIEGVEVKQRTWFRSELARLGRLIGVGILECAESNNWLEF